tara:strand:- start:2882 stop:3391 length:510 start_codon:yes stop_codon:yes gene_type:complete
MSWSKSTEGKSVLLKETVTIADSAGANASYIPTSIIPNDLLDWEDKKFSVTLKVTETSATDGDVDAYIQTSANGLTTGDVVTPGSGAHPNWINSVTLNYTIDTSAESVASLEADCTDIYGPYMRIWLFTDGADIQDACSIEVSIAGVAGNEQQGLHSSDFAGNLGKDPS